VRIGAELEDLIDQYERDIVTVVQKTSFELFRRVVFKTPVEEGVARNSWNCSESTPKFDERAASGRGSDSLNEIVSVLGMIKTMDDRTIYLTNGLPYIGKLEYGGYPNPVKRGTWVKGKGMYEVRTVAGYSVKAPQGMVRISIEEWRGFFEQLAKA